jgi:hypothetical protein
MPKKIASMKKANPSSENGSPDDAAREGHEPREQQAELEADDRSGHCADSEQDGERPRPAARQRPPDRVAGPQVKPFRDDHHQRQPHAEDGEREVEGQRRAHLRAAGRHVVDHRAEGDQLTAEHHASHAIRYRVAARSSRSIAAT